jgi:hypothetical protein
MQHLDEGTIHAWLDGELPLAEREAAEAHVATCASCAAAVAEARGFIAASSRILTSLDAVPAGVLPRAQSAPVRRFTVSRAWMAAAAVLVLGIGTVIATQRDREVAALHVASQREEAKSTAVLPNAGPAALDKATVDSTAPAPIASPVPRAPARAPATSPPQMVGAIASGAQTLASKDEARLKNAPAPAPVATEKPEARDAKRADAAPEPAPQAMPPVVAQSSAAKSAGATIGDTARRRMMLNEVVVTRAALPAEADSTEPQLAARDTVATGADTTITSIYSVNGVLVSLVDRPSLKALQRAPSVSGKSGFSDAVMAKARAQAPPENSITWSDSTGRTRTLRGAMSHEALERLKARLFGATP